MGMSTLFVLTPTLPRRLQPLLIGTIVKVSSLIYLDFQSVPNDTPAPLEMDTQHHHQRRAEPYSPGVAVNRNDFTAMHDPYGAGYPQNHALHTRQVEMHPPFRRPETDPGTYFPEARATYYAPQPLVNPGHERRSYRQPPGEAHLYTAHLICAVTSRL